MNRPKHLFKVFVLLVMTSTGLFSPAHAQENTKSLSLTEAIAFLLIGGYSTFLIPRDEEPQIQVPMADFIF